MKRVIAVILTCLLAVSGLVFAVTSASAANEPFKLTVTSNLFPKSVSTYKTFETDGNGNEFLTIEYKLNAPNKYIINFDINEITWDPSVLTFRPEDNKLGSTERNKMVWLTPFTYDQQRGPGLFNYESSKINNGMILGNFSAVLPAAYAYNEDGSAISFFKIKFLVKDKSAGAATVNVNIIDINLDDDTDTQPRSKYPIVNQNNVNYENIEKYVSEMYVVTDGQPFGFTVNGVAECYANNDDNVQQPVKLSLIPENETEAKYETSVTATEKDKNSYKVDYSFTGVEEGKYTLRVEKTNHVTRDYDLEVTADTKQNVKIHLKGDINGDGRVRANDAGQAYAQAMNSKQLDSYLFKVADVTGDGRVRNNDCAQIYAHAMGTKFLFE